MTTSLQWPAQLPEPLIETHSLKPRPPVVRSEIERGAAQQRRRFTSVVTEVPFSLVLDEEQVSIWEAWVEYRALHGARWFAITLLTAAGRTSHEARVLQVEETKELTAQRWRVAGTFEVRDRPISAEALP